MFQSTLPRRERPPRNPASYLLMCVSIHAPTQGATIDAAIEAAKQKGFNPRSHAGSDVGFGMQGGSDVAFQSTLPRRERRDDSRKHGWGKIVSIHAPTQGATIIPLYVEEILPFQSTLPRRERR